MIADSLVGPPIRDTVFRLAVGATLLVVLWYLIKARTRGHDGRIAALYRILDPQVQTMRIWLSMAPATFTYIGMWTATSIIIQGTPERVASVLDRYNSTNIAGILEYPLRALVSSGLLVADNGYGYIFYVVVYAVILARLEYRIGSARAVLVTVGAHILASLIIVGTEKVLINMGIFSPLKVFTADVGVSYIMVAGCGGYALLVGKTWRWWYWAALFIGIGLPVLLRHQLWDIGHFLATSLGLLFTWLLLRYGVRPALDWRTIAVTRTPRELPTFSTEPKHF